MITSLLDGTTKSSDAQTEIKLGDTLWLRNLMLEKFVKAEYLSFDSHNLSIKLKETIMHEVFVADQDLSFDSKPADQVTTIQTWLF